MAQEIATENLRAEQAKIMGRQSTYERQRNAAKALKATEPSGKAVAGDTTAVKKQSTSTHKRPGGRRVAPPARPIAPDTSNLGPDGAVLFEILLTPDQVALWLQKPKSTLYAWRTRGQGPRAIKVGSDLRYRRVDVEAWLDSQVLDLPA